MCGPWTSIFHSVPGPTDLREEATRVGGPGLEVRLGPQGTDGEGSYEPKSHQGAQTLS